MHLAYQLQNDDGSLRKRDQATVETPNRSFSLGEIINFSYFPRNAPTCCCLYVDKLGIYYSIDNSRMFALAYRIQHGLSSRWRQRKTEITPKKSSLEALELQSDSRRPLLSPSVSRVHSLEPYKARTTSSNIFSLGFSKEGASRTVVYQSSSAPRSRSSSDATRRLRGPPHT